MCILSILTLLEIEGVGNKTVIKIINRNSSLPEESAELFDYLKKVNSEGIKIKIPDYDEFLDFKNNASKTIKKCFMENIKIISIVSDEYPELLKMIDNPPAILYVKGNLSLMNSKSSIAVVGTRFPSKLAKDNARETGQYLAGEGITVVSGLALGCDYEAHNGTLEKAGKTIAILPAALDKIVPKANSELSEKILENNGTLISEYKPGTIPREYQYVSRNRIQSGLSLGTIIVETKIDGGTMKTAEYCLKQQRLLGVFYDEKSSNITGNHQLIKEKNAFKITGIQDIKGFIKESRINYDEIKKTSKTYFSSKKQISLFDVNF